jgi:hypothetical protein
MASKPPVSFAPPTLKQARAESAPIILKKSDSPALGIEGAASELAIACKMGENPNSVSRFLRLLSAIRPADVDALVPGTEVSVRALLEQLAFNSIHNEVRLVVHGLLESEIIVVQSDTGVSGAAPMDTIPENSCRSNHPGFSKPPARISALELLREYVEGKLPGIHEAELHDAIETLKYDKDSEVASMLAYVACASPYKSVQEKAREALLEF